MTKNVLWRDLYAAAMIELDHASLQKSIQDAEAAIRQAFTEQWNAHDGRDVEELQAMTEAIRNLEMLRKLELSAPIGTISQNFCPVKGAIS